MSVPTIAVLGGGAVTRLLYAPALCALGASRVLETTAVVDRSGDALRKLASSEQRVADRSLESSYEDFLADPRRLAGLDAVIVALPHHLHEACVVLALDAGLHVFCEKPLGLGPEEVKRMDEAARRATRVLAVCQPRRSYPAARAIRGLLDRGWLGKVERVMWEEGQPYAWPAESLALVQREYGGEEVFDIGAHVFDLLCWWLGPLELQRYKDDSRGGAGAHFEIGLRSATGASVEVRLSRLFLLSNKVVVQCQRGRVSWDVRTPESFHVQLADGDGLPEPMISYPALGTRWPHEAFCDQLRDFAHEITVGGTKTIAGARDALHYARIFSACRDAQTHSTVHFPEVRSAELQVVTGAAGFVGCRLVERLLENNESVRALVRRPQSCIRVARTTAELERCDVTQIDSVKQALRGADVVFHCAGSAKNSRETIVEGTVNVLQAAEANNVRRVVVFSSMLAYGDPPPEGIVTENRSGAASTMEYAQAKRELERRCQGFTANSRTEVVILEPTCIFGPFGSDFVASQLDAMRSGEFFLIEGGAGSANLVYVDNVVDAAILASSQACKSGTRYIINEEEWLVTWTEYFGELGQSVFGLSAGDFPSLSLSQFAEIVQTRKRLRSFPTVVRHAIRAYPPARDWLQGSWMFRAWTAGKQLGRSGPRPTGSTIGAGPTNDHESPNGRRLVEELKTCPKLHFTSSVARFFSSKATYSSDRIRQELGWSPRVDRAAAMKATLEWAQESYRHRPLSGALS